MAKIDFFFSFFQMLPSRLNFIILHIFLILEDLTAIPNKKKRHIRKRGSIRGRFFKLLASHKLPKDDASQHNDLPKRDFSRVFSSAGEVTGGFLPIDTYQNTRHFRDEVLKTIRTLYGNR